MGRDVPEPTFGQPNTRILLLEIVAHPLTLSSLQNTNMPHTQGLVAIFLLFVIFHIMYDYTIRIRIRIRIVYW